MGLRLETYNENFVGLIVDFSLTEDSQSFCSSDSVESAIAYFDLYIDENSKSLKRRTVEDKLALNINNVETFQKQLANITSKLTDEEAKLNEMLFADWSFNKVYEVGDRVRCDGILYKCLAHHTSEKNQVPDLNPTLWAQLSVSDTPEEWINGRKYTAGTKVLYNNMTYESQIDNNIWEPGSTGTESLWAKV